MSSGDEYKIGAAKAVFEKVLSSENLAGILLSILGKDDAEEILSEAAGRDGRNKKPPREAYNIQFAQGLSTKDLITLLQHELLRARTSDSEVTLPTSIVHDIKFRLNWYMKNHGEVDRPAPKKVGTRRL